MFENGTLCESAADTGLDVEDEQGGVRVVR